MLPVQRERKNALYSMQCTQTHNMSCNHYLISQNPIPYCKHNFGSGIVVAVDVTAAAAATAASAAAFMVIVDCYWWQAEANQNIVASNVRARSFNPHFDYPNQFLDKLHKWICQA